MQTGAFKLIDFEAIASLKTEEELFDVIKRFSSSLNFETVTATVVHDTPEGPIFCVNDNAPDTARHLVDDTAKAAIDPVMQHCKTSSRPIVWGQKNYVDAGLGELYEEQAPHGYQSGVCLAIHLPGGKHYVIGADRGIRAPASPEAALHEMAMMSLFASYVVDTAVSLSEPRVQHLLAKRTIDVKLSEKEKECLRWTLCGKTAWEVGQIMGISERTAGWHLGNAIKRLDCVNKHQAATKAVRLGLIT